MIRKFQHILLILIIFYVGIITTYSQISTELGSPFIRNYSPKEYAESSQNWCVFQDGRGLIYIGNTAGLLEFDGKNWRSIYTPNQSVIRCLIQDQDGLIYVSANNEFGYLACDLAGKLSYVSLVSKLKKDDLKFNDVNRILIHNGSVYFFSNSIIFKLHNDNLTKIPVEINSRYASFLCGKIFVFNKKTGLSNFENDKLINIESTKILCDAGKLALMQYSNNKILIASEKQGLYLLELSSDISKSAIRKFESEIAPYIQTNSLLSGVAIDDNRFAFGTLHGGIIICDENGKSVQIINRKRGLQDNSILCMMVDKNKNLWTGNQQGVSQIALNYPVSRFLEENGIAGSVYKVIRYKDFIYAATPTGLFYLPPYKMQMSNDEFSFLPVPGLHSGQWEFTYINGQLVLVGQDGIVELDGLKLRFLSHTATYGYTFGKSPLFPDNLFLGTTDGIEIFDIVYPNVNKNNFEIKSHGKIKGINFQVRGFESDNDSNVWATTAFNGLIQLRFSDKNIDNYKIVIYDTIHGLPKLDYNYMKIIDDKYVVYNSKGVYAPIFDEQSKYIKKFIKSDRLGKIFNDSIGIWQIEKDINKNLWAYTTTGFGRLEHNAAGRYYLNYNFLNLVPFQSAYYFYIDEQNIIWICTNEGLFRYDSKMPVDVMINYNCIIRKATIGKDSVIFGGTFFDTKVKRNGKFVKFLDAQQPSQIPEIDYKNNSITINYSALFYQNDLDIQFSYQLDGFDKAWSAWSKETKKEYTNLPPGKYTFKVKAKNVFENISEPAEYNFVIKPPVYLTLFAFVIYFLFIILFIYFGILLNTLRLKKTNQKLERLVRDRTFEIIQRKEEIKAQAQQLEKTNKELEKLSIVASHTDNAVIILNAQGNFEWVNDGFIRLYGYTFEQFIKARGSSILTASTNTDIKSIFERCIKTQRTVHYESFTIDKYKKKIWLHTTITPIVDEHENITKFIAIESDISKVKEAENEIHQQKEEIQAQADQLEQSNRELEKLSIVASHTDNAVFITDVYGNFEWVNDGFRRLYGISYEQLLEVRGQNLFETTTHPNAPELIRKCIEQKKSFNYDSYTILNSGDKIWLQTTITPILDNTGTVTKLIAIETDITKLKEAENEILQQKEEIQTQADQLEQTNRELQKLSIVASHTDNAVFILDAFGNIEWVNQAFSRVYGYNSIDDFFVERNSNILFASTNPYISEIINECLHDKKSVNYESYTTHANKKRIWLQTTITPILDKEGNVWKLVAIETEITTIKEAKLEILKQKEEITSQAEMLEEANHELQKLSLIASKTDNAVLLVDSRGLFEWVNEAYIKLFEYTLDQLINEISPTIIGPNTPEHIRTTIQTCFEIKETVSYEFFTKSRSGKNIWVQATLTPILDEYGDIDKVIIIDSDISQLKLAEQDVLIKSEEIQVQKEILQLQNDEILKQRDKLHSYMEDVRASIRYALTIQQTILPIKSKFDEIFENFIMYLPKDIVSGDFFWLTRIKGEIYLNEKIFIAVVDCTGHGVPGAFMSLIGSRLLNEIVIEKKIYEPFEILENLNFEIKKSLQQDQTENNDGMDICLVRIEKTVRHDSQFPTLADDEKYTITFAGANRPLFYYKHSSKEIFTVKSEKKVIGGARAVFQEIPFTNRQIFLQKNDCIYLTTDGYIDQNDIFGKRLGSKRFRELLTEIGSLPMEEQKTRLDLELAKHQQKLEQRDDITIIGLKM